MISQRLDITMPDRIPKPVIANILPSENDPVTAFSTLRNKPGCTANITMENTTRGRMIHRDRPIHILSMKSEIKSITQTKYSRLKRISSAELILGEEIVFM
jgi:hypothetical protein